MAAKKLFRYDGEVPISLMLDGRYRRIKPGDKIPASGETVVSPDGEKVDWLELNGFSLVKPARRTTKTKKTTPTTPPSAGGKEGGS